MKELQNYAIILIYPDGVIEKIPITNFEFHIEYYRDHMKKSPRFAKLCRSLALEIDETISYDDYPVDAATDDVRNKLLDILGDKGILIIENLNVYDIVYDMDFLKEEQCAFLIYFPEFFLSCEQLEAYLGYSDYPEYLLHLAKFNKKQGLHLDINYEEMEEFINAAKEEFMLDSLKR